MSKAIGIDLGTTNSCVSVMEGGVPVIIPNELGERTTPSVVAFTASGERLIGSAAKRQASVNAANTIASIKREMGTDWRKTMNGKAYSPQEISAMILRKLRQDAEDYLGETVSDAVITVPAYFNDMQRQATKDAGRIAGLNVLRIINEPTSAALAYGLNHGQQQKIMVYDLGGGTFDVSIIDIGEDVIEVMATAGDNHLGGDDFDAALVQWMVQDFQAKNHYDPTKDVTVKKRLEEAAEQAKKELSASEVAYVNLPFLAQHMGQPVHYEATITCSKFNELTRHLVDRTAGPVQQALNDAGIAPSELAMVLLVGGSTRIPAVQEKVKALTGKNPSKNINPDECVAQGAAIQAEALSSTTATSSLLLLDVTPLSLSIETMGGVATRLIERNSALPTSYSRVFTTAAPFQSSVEINVLQGERPMAADNKSIGKFKLKGIKRAMAGVPKIEVSFSLDTNGILTVSARDQDTGNSQSITISGNGKMSDAEIQQAIRDAEQHTAQDGMRREAIESLNQAQMLIGQTEALLASQGKQMPKEQKQAIKSKLSDLKKLTLRTKAEKMSADEVRLLQSATEALTAVVGPMMGNQM